MSALDPHGTLYAAPPIAFCRATAADEKPESVGPTMLRLLRILRASEIQTIFHSSAGLSNALLSRCPKA